MFVAKRRFNVGQLALRTQRLLLVLTITATIALAVLTRPAPAQYPTGAAGSTYTPVTVNVLAGGDPYATVGAQPAAWWNSGGLTLPSRESMRDRFWWRGEYLHWWTEGMDVPPLVTTSPDTTPQAMAGVLGQPATAILFGGSEINDDSVSGYRSRSGFWLQGRAFAIESEFFRLSDQKDGFSASSDGSAILARPFFDAVTGMESAQLISYPNLVAGSIGVTSKTRLKSYLINGRASLIPLPTIDCIPCEQPDRVDWLVGYRYLKLDDQIFFSENLTSLVPTAPGTIAISEGFRTRNEFNGLQLGVVYQANFRRAWLESMLRVAVGNNKQEVIIGGGTTITEAGTATSYTGGLLAQRTNIGTYQRDEFTAIPEIGTTVGIRVTDCLHATIGYSLLYFPNVVRAGNQIDTDLNPNLLPPETVPFSGPPRPRFRFVESQYWAQGINLGAELRY